MPKNDAMDDLRKVVKIGERPLFENFIAG